MNDKKKFESQYVKRKSGCWNWIAGMSGGYGKFWFQGKRVLAHRFSYELYVGKITNDLHVLHKCNNKQCVNPDHLYLGTEYDNTQDKIKDGNFYGYGSGTLKNRKGQEHPASKLKDVDVIKIKRLLKEGAYQHTIAAMFNVTRRAIGLINTGENWSHIII